MSALTDPPAAFRSRLPNDGKRFVLSDAARAMEVFYREERLDGCEHDWLAVAAGKFGEGTGRHFEIGLFRSFDLFRTLQVTLHFPLSIRCLFFQSRCYFDICDSMADLDGFLAKMRSSRWFRRFAAIPADVCSITWRDRDEGIDSYSKLLPRLMEAMASHL